MSSDDHVRRLRDVKTELDRVETMVIEESAVTGRVRNARDILDEVIGEMEGEL